jgi:hypothetical protein
LVNDLQQQLWIYLNSEVTDADLLAAFLAYWNSEEKKAQPEMLKLSKRQI